jgi:hypothetical protein
MAELVMVNDEMEIRKSEALVKSRYKLKPLPLKLITTLISCVQSSDSIDQEYCIRVKDFTDIADLKGNDYYDKLREACYDIMSKPVEIGKKGSKDFLICNWASSCQYIDQEGNIKFHISPKLFPHILNLKQNYLKYDLSNILALRSDYSIRVYEWLKDEFNTKGRYGKSAEMIMKLEEIRNILDVPKSYLWNDVKRRILDKAKDDLLANCDIKFDWEVASKLGKKVSHIKFKIYPNSANLKEDTKLPTYLSGFMQFVKYLRDLYRGTQKYVIALQYDLGQGKQAYYFALNNDGIMYGTSLNGGDSIGIVKETSELIYNACYLCAIHSEVYRDFISSKGDIWELSKDYEHKEYWGILKNNIVSVLKEHDFRSKPMF